MTAASKQQKTSHRLTQFLIVLGVALVWEVVSRTGVVNPQLLPPFSAVMAEAGALLSDPKFLFHLGITAGEVGLSLLIVAPLGFAIGLLLAESEYIGKAFLPFFNFLSSVPKSIFLPMFILTFGIGFNQKVAFGVFQAIFVLVVSTVAAVASVPKEYIKLARAYSASRTALYVDIYWPAMLPFVLEGFRLGVIFSITGVIFAEMSASRAGLGSQIATWGQTFQMTSLYAGVVVASGLSIAINELIRAYEARVSRWRR